MADQLFLSYWIRGFSANSMLRHYEKLLHQFPFSVLTKAEAILQIRAVDEHEPVLVELPFLSPPELEALVATCRDFQNEDSCFQLETAWDLWRYEGDWKLEPSRVTLSCFGPSYPSEEGENLRMELGLESHFLPDPDLPNGLYMARSNLRSLMTLVHKIDDALPASKRRLFSESGENFAEKLRDAVEE
jgi:hypothetical protein